MKYFIDTEFIEGFKKPLFGKKRHFIDLISIGIKCEDGREYYAVSNEFNANNADQWVKDNVISKLYDEDGIRLGRWISNKQIAEEIIDFVMPYAECENGESCCRFYDPEPEDLIGNTHKLIIKRDSPQFYAYYADYDWVVFCSLFGRMIDLPKGFPMYCIDLKQMLDETASIGRRHKDGFERALSSTKNHPNYPKQENEHSSLDDARWNLELYNFLDTIR